MVVFAGCGARNPPFFKPIPPVVHILPNRLTLILLEDHEVPTAKFYFYIQGGSVYDPPGKEGLASVAMQSIRLGGTTTRSPESIEEDLEFVGASLEMGIKPEYAAASLNVLKKDLNLGLDILFDLLKKPAIQKNRFEIVKAQAIDTLERELEDPLTLANREFPELIYGPHNPWGRKVTVASLKNITYEDVRSFYKNFVHPDRILLAAAGDFSDDAITALIHEKNQDWNVSSSGLPALPSVSESFKREVVVIPRRDLTQSTIIMGHLGTKRDNPDKFPLIVMNFILGGGGALSSRLGEEIRSSAGKAYAIWSDYGFGKDLGTFRAIAQTALTNTDWVIHRMETMIREMTDSPNFTQEEVSRAKQAVLRSLVFGFETRFAQVKEEARFKLYGYPDNYLEIFQKEIARVSVKDLNRVAKKYLHPEGLKVLIITNDEETKHAKALSDLTTNGLVEVRRFE